jgi:N-methylhydantoinase A
MEQLAPVYDRASLPAGTTLDGPALIEEASSTLLVPYGARATVQPCGNVVVELPEV